MSKQKTDNRAGQAEPRTLLRNHDTPRQEYIPGVRSREQTLMMQGRKPTDPTTEYRNQQELRQEYIPGARSREQTLMMQGRKPTDPTTEYRNASAPRQHYEAGVISDDNTLLMHKATSGNVGQTVSIAARKTKEKKSRRPALIIAAALVVLVAGGIGAGVLLGQKPAAQTADAPLVTSAPKAAEVTMVPSPARIIEEAAAEAVQRLENNDLDGAGYAIFNARETIFSYAGEEAATIAYDQYAIHVSRNGSMDESMALVEVLFEDSASGLPVALLSFSNQGEIRHRGAFDQASGGVALLKDAFRWETVMQQIQQKKQEVQAK